MNQAFFVFSKSPFLQGFYFTKSPSAMNPFFLYQDNEGRVTLKNICLCGIFLCVYYTYLPFSFNSSNRCFLCSTAVLLLSFWFPVGTALELLSVYCSTLTVTLNIRSWMFALITLMNQKIHWGKWHFLIKTDKRSFENVRLK